MLLNRTSGNITHELCSIKTFYTSLATKQTVCLVRLLAALQFLYFFNFHNYDKFVRFAAEFWGEFSLLPLQIPQRAGNVFVVNIGFCGIRLCQSGPGLGNSPFCPANEIRTGILLSPRNETGTGVPQNPNNNNGLDNNFTGLIFVRL